MKSFSLFIDFDNTITTDDVGNRFYTFFSQGKNEPVVAKWLKREISAYDCLKEEARLVRGSLQEFSAYVDKFEIDGGFAGLVEICRRQNIPLRILSDGLDFYISHILKKYGFAKLEVICNRAHFSAGGLQIEIPHRIDECASCGSCKGQRIRELRRRDDTVIYIGDGLSDLCGAREAELVFAKDDLAELLKAEARAYIEYRDLYEVGNKLTELFQSARGRCTQQGG